jgi:hypothetical protein
MLVLSREALSFLKLVASTITRGGTPVASTGFESMSRIIASVIPTTSFESTPIPETCPIAPGFS